jgi:hypothetical protein
LIAVFRSLNKIKIVRRSIFSESSSDRTLIPSRLCYIRDPLLFVIDLLICLFLDLLLTLWTHHLDLRFLYWLLLLLFVFLLDHNNSSCKWWYGWGSNFLNIDIIRRWINDDDLVVWRALKLDWLLLETHRRDDVLLRGLAYKLWFRRFRLRYLTAVLKDLISKA